MLVNILNAVLLLLHVSNFCSNQATTEADSARERVSAMLREYEWIATDRMYFGQPNTAYDFEATDPKEAGRSVKNLREKKEKLEKSVNVRAMTMLEKAEEQYNDLMRKKLTVENDKAKIEQVSLVILGIIKWSLENHFIFETSEVGIIKRDACKMYSTLKMR